LIVRIGVNGAASSVRPAQVCTAIAERATTISLMMEESEKNDDRNWNS
jgi:hypothetical protein